VRNDGKQVHKIGMMSERGDKKLVERKVGGRGRKRR
jgi:hypothetical protein